MALLGGMKWPGSKCFHIKIQFRAVVSKVYHIPQGVSGMTADGTFVLAPSFTCNEIPYWLKQNGGM